MDSAIHNPQVPYDLLRPIFDHLQQDKASLRATSLASSACRDEAQHILFRKVDALTRYTAHLKFLRTVAASPTRLALFVHTYSHCWIINLGNPTIEDFMNDLQNIVGDGLKAMSCLKELTIEFAYSPRAIDTTYIHILSACTFRLERFHWLTQSDPNELFAKFLVYQPTLRRLALSNELFGDNLPIIASTTCPHLVSIMGDWDMIKAFLPGRNISILRSSKCDWEDINIKPLAAELKRLKFLSIYSPALWRIKSSDLNNLQCLSSLNSLVIYWVGFWDADEDIRVQSRMPRLVAILSELPALQTLTLTGHYPLRTPEEDIELTHNLFAKFGEHLQCIYIGVAGRSHSYSRYIQSQETIQKVSEEEARKWWL